MRAAETRKSVKTEEKWEPEKCSTEMLRYWAALKTHRGWWMEKNSARDSSRDWCAVQGALRTKSVVKQPEK